MVTGIYTVGVKSSVHKSLFGSNSYQLACK